MAKIVVTGCAGFIGAATSLRLLEEGNEVKGIDNLNDYYSVKLKLARLQKLSTFPNFVFEETDICDRESINMVFSRFNPSIVIHLAAQAGVRFALSNPYLYGDTNLVGFLNVIEKSRESNVSHFVYASSSSVYGLNKCVPFTEDQVTQHPISLYAATKLANESIAHAYAYSFNLRCTGLRFFTVYGPWGRPDMAPMKFANSILRNEPINLFNSGNHIRDFTYIDDIVDGVVGMAFSSREKDSEFNPMDPNPGLSPYPSRLFNIGGNSPVVVTDFLDLLESYLGHKTLRILLPQQIGDVAATHASTSSIQEAIGWSPKTNLETGLFIFADWAKSHPDLLS